MRRLTKLDEPEILRTQRAKWEADLESDPNSDTNKTRYRHADVKAQILEETHKKCVYCESKIRHIAPGDIEHMLPIMHRKDLRFEWANLTFACPECNRRKGSYHNTEVPFLNPYTDPVEELLIHVGPLVFSVPGNPSAAVTVVSLELNRNRLDLFERKAEHLAKAHTLSERRKAVSSAFRPLLDSELTQMTQVDQEYSAMTAAFLAQLIPDLPTTEAPPGPSPEAAFPLAPTS